MHSKSLMVLLRLSNTINVTNLFKVNNLEQLSDVNDIFLVFCNVEFQPGVSIIDL